MDGGVKEVLSILHNWRLECMLWQELDGSLRDSNAEFKPPKPTIFKSPDPLTMCVQMQFELVCLFLEVFTEKELCQKEESASACYRILRL